MVGSPRPRLPSPHRPRGFPAWAPDPTPPYLPRPGGGCDDAPAGGPTAGGEPLGPAVASFLAERDLAPSSRRVYVLALHRLLDRVDADTPLAEVSPRMLAEFMTATYPHLAPASYNRVVATLASLFAYTTRQGWTPTSPATGLE